jgi:Flp pilus assembly protein TadD
LTEGAHLLLTAPRRIGKTSLLKETARRLAGPFLCLYIDLQKAESAADAVVELSLATREYQSAWDRVSSVFQNVLKDTVDTIKVKDLSIVLRGGLTADNWRSKGDALFQILADQDRPVALFFDEVAILVNRLLRGGDYVITDQRRAEVDAFLSWLRANSVRHQGRVRIVLTGSIGLEPLVREAGLSATLNTFTPFHLGPWARDTARGCLSALAQGYSLVLPPQAIDEMLDRLGMYIPHHVQMFFDHVYQEACLAGSREVSVALVKDVYQRSMLGIRGHVELSHMEERLKMVLGPKLDLLALDLLTDAAVDEATKACRKSIELDSKDASSWRMLGRLLANLRRFDEAEGAFLTATERDPKDACAWHHLGRMMNERRRHADAERACRRAVEIDPKHTGAWNDLGIVLNRLGRREEAEEAFLRGAKLDTRDDAVWRNLAGLYRRSGRLEEARRAYKNAIERAPGDKELWSEAGHFILAVGQPKEAERIWEQALKLHPSLMPCAVHILDARQQLGVPRTILMRQAAEWIERSGRAVRVLRPMAHFALTTGLTKALPTAEDWAKEALSQDRSWESAHTLAIVYAAQTKWLDALQTCQPVLDAAARLKAAREDATALLIQAAAAGHAGEALEALSASKGAEALEPLLVGLQMYLGGAPKIAKEIREIGQDVADRIRTLAERSNSGKRKTRIKKPPADQDQLTGSVAT